MKEPLRAKDKEEAEGPFPSAVPADVMVFELILALSCRLQVGGTREPFLAPGPSLLFLKKTGKKGCGNMAGARRDSGFFSKEEASWEGCRREKGVGQGCPIPRRLHQTLT